MLRPQSRSYRSAAERREAMEHDPESNDNAASLLGLVGVLSAGALLGAGLLINDIVANGLPWSDDTEPPLQTRPAAVGEPFPVQATPPLRLHYPMR